MAINKRPRAPLVPGLSPPGSSLEELAAWAQSAHQILNGHDMAGATSRVALLKDLLSRGDISALLGLRPLERQVVTSPVGQVDFTVGLDGTYDTLLFTFFARPAVNSDGLLWRISQGGSVKSDSGYRFGGVAMNESPALSAFGSAGVTTSFTIAGAIKNTANAVVSGFSLIWDVASTAHHKHVFSFASPYRATDIALPHIVGGFYTNSTAAVDGIRFLFAGGNVTEGVFSSYGLRKAA